ncbi:MAG: ABC transporter permease [Candidatus Roizmanbacteria bacterium]
MITLIKKELSYYLNNPVGYVILVLFAVFANFLYMKDVFVTGSGSMRAFFGVLPWLILIFVPAISMRIFSEEKRTNTIETLLTLPISEFQIVIAKFVSLVIVYSIGIGLTLCIPFALKFMANIYIPEVLIAYIGTIFFASSFLSISIFFSSLTRNQVVAFLSSIITLFILVSFSTDFLATIFPKSIQDFFGFISPLNHFENFVKGVVDIRSVFYFVSLSAVFLFLTVINVEKRD